MLPQEQIDRLAYLLLELWLMQHGLYPMEFDPSGYARDYGPHRVYIADAHIPMCTNALLGIEPLIVSLTALIKAHNQMVVPMLRFQVYNVEIYHGCDGDTLYASICQ